MRELLVGRLLEGVDPHAGGVRAAQDVLDRAVLAGRVDALQHDQQRALLLRVQALLQVGDLLDQPAVLALDLLRRRARRCRRVGSASEKRSLRLDAVAREVGELRRARRPWPVGYPWYARRMPAGIVLAGGRSSRMGTPKAWLDWHGTTLLRRVCGLVARGAGGPVVVVRAPGQELPPLPDGVRVVEDEREGRGPLQGLLAGLEAVDEDVAFVASTDVPFLHPRFVAAVCRGAGRRRRRRPARSAATASRCRRLPDGARAARGRAGRGRPDEAGLPVRALRGALAGASCRTPRACATSTRREDYEAARAEPAPLVHVRCFGPAEAPGGRPARRDARRRRRGGRRRRSTSTSSPRSTATRSRATRSSRSPRATRWR